MAKRPKAGEPSAPAPSRKATRRTGNELLFEIGTEEIPARFLPGVRRQLEELAVRLLLEHGLGVGRDEVHACATPRRLVLHVRGLPAAQEDRRLEVLGPAKEQGFAPDGRPTPAAEGFARKHGVAVSDLVEKETEKGLRLAYVAVKEGKPAAEVLSRVLAELVAGLGFPKTMRWPQSETPFARPIRWLLVLHGRDMLPVTAGGVTAGRTTWGLRFVHPKPLRVGSVADYFRIMKRCGIVLEVEDRRRMIEREAERLASRARGSAHRAEGLVGEVADLVEAPRVFLGSFSREALALPAAVTMAAMVEHQRYFPVWETTGKLAPRFVGVANGVSTPEVVAGNERVLKARLADAAFFHREDRKRRLEDFLPRLGGVVWQAGAGSMLDKSRRLEELAGWVAERSGADPAAARRAGLLAKADLVTQVVFEFPTLQGVAGGIYAEADGEPREVAAAIQDHHRPRGPNDEPPPSGLGAAVALADKADSLAGHFALGHSPSGTADPYGLRRAGIGMARIMWDRDWRISISSLFGRALEGLNRHGLAIGDAADVARRAAAFLADRVQVILAEQGFSHDEIRAALVDFDDIVLAGKRMRAIAALRARPDFRDTVFALSRVTNILPGDHRGEEVNAVALGPEELALFDAHEAVRESVAQLALDGRFERVYEQLASLKPAIDAFFGKVLVMDPDENVRARRLSLLARVAKSIRLFADVKQLVVS